MHGETVKNRSVDVRIPTKFTKEAAISHTEIMEQTSLEKSERYHNNLLNDIFTSSILSSASLAKQYYSRKLLVTSIIMNLLGSSCKESDTFTLF